MHYQYEMIDMDCLKCNYQCKLVVVIWLLSFPATTQVLPGRLDKYCRRFLLDERKKANVPFAFQTLHILCITEIQRPLSCSNVLKATPRLSGPKFKKKNYCVTAY